jgi:hypothetical protein
VNVYVLVLFLLLPNGEERASMTRVSACPSQAVLTASLQKMVKEHQIKAGTAYCSKLDMGREA